MYSYTFKDIGDIVTASVHSLVMSPPLDPRGFHMYACNVTFMFGPVPGRNGEGFNVGFFDGVPSTAQVQLYIMASLFL